MKKKGFEINAEALKVIIPAVILLIVMLFIMNGLVGHGAAETNDNMACKASVLENAKIKMANKGALGTTELWTSEIKCPMQTITIAESDDNKIMEQTAEAMYTCWDNFGKGQLNIFPTERGADDVFCAYCSEITYTAKGKSINGFMDYLENNGPPRSQINYLDDFTGVQPGDTELKSLSSMATNTIDTNKNYAVVFAYSKKVGVYDKLIQGAAVGGGTATGLIVLGLTSGAFTGGIGTALTLGVIAVGSFATGGFAFVHGPELSQNWLGGVHLLEKDDSNTLKALKCTELGVKP